MGEGLSGPAHSLTCTPLAWEGATSLTSGDKQESTLSRSARGDLKFFGSIFTLGRLNPFSGLTLEQIMKGLILAQNERWRRGSGMQVERIPGGNSRGKWRKGQ